MHAINIIIGDVIVLGAAAAVLGPRLYKNYRRKVGTQNAFLIKNVASVLVIRPRNAEIDDGVPIVQYTPQNWECTTWQMIGIGTDTYLLKDLYTQKSLAPDNQGMLAQVPLGGNVNQHWVFAEVVPGQFTIRLADAELYLTSPNREVNARLQLAAPTNTDNQRWTLTAQHPII